MPHPIEPSTLHILKSTGETVGTGFLVSKNLAVTCAHVVKILGAGAGDTIDIRFTGKSASTSAHVLPEYWRPDDSTDIAILQVDEVPVSVFPLRMGKASESRLKNDLYTFGYAIAGEEQGIGGLGTFITLKQEGNFIQFRMHEANHGHSGAPIYDDQRGVVVGMIKKGHTGAGRNAETTFAIPAETIWQVCPQLKPPTPILPRRNPIVEGINLLPYDYDQRIQNFLTEYLGTDTHPVPFGGRDDALKMLDTWLAETTPYLLLAAPAGRGKSALLVRWLDSLSARENLALAFVPVSIRFGTNMERVFYAALAARLAFLHGDDIPASSETSTAVYRGLVSDYLSKPLANGRTLLVVLDGLDEAADWRIKADFMPAELPAGVRVIVSARFLVGDADSKPWLSRLNWERGGLASAPPLTPLDQEGVRDVLFKMGCPLDELGRQVDIVAELYRLSAGDPLLVGLYVGDLWAKGESVTRLNPEDLAGIQPGYKGYFDRWWEDQKELWGRQKPWLEQHVRTMRSLLAGALGPLYTDDLQSLAPELVSDHITDALDVLKRFVIGDNQIQGYTFSHPKLAQYFWEILTESERAAWEKRFLDWGENTLQEFIDGKRDPTKKKEVPFYVVSNYGIHLTRANQPIDKWLPLIHHQQWAQAWFTVEGAYGGYHQDIQNCANQCRIINHQFVQKNAKPPYITEQIRCVLIEASISSLVRNIKPQLIWPLIRDGVWTWSQAWIFIRQISDLSQLAGIFEVMFPYLPTNQLSVALDVANSITDEATRIDVISMFAVSYPDMNIDILPDIYAVKNEIDRARTLRYLVQRLPPNQLSKLLEPARTISEGWRGGILIELAKKMPEDQLAKLLKDVDLLQDEYFRFSVLTSLAERLSEFIKEVMRFAQTIANKKLQSDTVKWLVINIPLAQLGEVSELAQKIEDEKEYYFIQVEISKRFPGEGLDQLVELALQTPNSWERDLRLSYIAERYVMYKLDNAIALVRQISNEALRKNVFFEMLKQNPESIDAILALPDLTEQDRKDFRQRLTYLADIKVEGLIRGAERPGSNHQLNIASLRNIIQTLSEDQLKAVLEYTRKKISRGYAERQRYDPDVILCLLVQRLPELTTEALTCVRRQRTRDGSAQLLYLLAECIPIQSIDEFLEATIALENEFDQFQILNKLIPRLSEEFLRKVLSITTTIKNPSYRSTLLSDLAQFLPGATADALSASSFINDKYTYTHLLSRITRYIPEISTKVLGSALLIGPDDTSEVAARKSLFEYIAQWIPTENMSDVITIAMGLEDKYIGNEILAAIIPRLPEALLIEVLEIARGMKKGKNQMCLLSKLAERIPDSKMDELLEIIGGVAQIDSSLEQTVYDIEKSNTLVAISRRVQEKRDSNPLRALRERIKTDKRCAKITSISLELNKYSREFLHTLKSMAQYFPERHLHKIELLVRHLGFDSDRLDVLSTIAERLPEVSNRAMATMMQMLISPYQKEDECANWLIALLWRLEKSYASQIMNFASQSLRKEENRALVYISLVERPCPELMDEIKSQVLKMESENSKARVLAVLVEHQDECGFDEIQNITYQMKDPEGKALVLTALAQKKSKLLDEALTAIKILPEENRVGMLISLLRYSDNEKVGEFFKLANEISDSQARAKLFIELAKRQPLLAQDAYKIIFTITRWDYYHRAKVLSELNNFVTNASEEEVYSVVDNNFRILAACIRADTFLGLSFTLPLVSIFSTNDNFREIYKAVRDVTTWWP